MRRGPLMKVDQYLLTYPGIGDLRSKCHVAVQRNNRRAIAGQLADNPGTSVTNALENVALAISQLFFDGSRDFKLFEYTPRDLVDRRPTLYAIRWHRPNAFQMPEWTKTDEGARLLSELHDLFPQPYTSTNLKGAHPVVFGQSRAPK